MKFDFQGIHSQNEISAVFEAWKQLKKWKFHQISWILEFQVKVKFQVKLAVFNSQVIIIATHTGLNILKTW